MRTGLTGGGREASPGGLGLNLQNEVTVKAFKRTNETLEPQREKHSMLGVEKRFYFGPNNAG